MADTVRFSEVVKNAGTPEVYLPLSDPKHDRGFMRAVKEQRVLSLKQEPTGTKKDFGTVGFVPEKYVSHLVFPRSLKAFEGQRVVGIKYDALQEAALSTPSAVTRTAGRGRSTKPKPPSKPKPRPKRFTAIVRLTSSNDVRVTVSAFNEDEARAKAEQEARNRRRALPSQVESEVVSVREKE
jgi:hypothetical protein